MYDISLWGGIIYGVLEAEGLATEMIGGDDAPGNDVDYRRQ